MHAHGCHVGGFRDFRHAGGIQGGLVATSKRGQNLCEKGGIGSTSRICIGKSMSQRAEIEGMGQ